MKGFTPVTGVPISLSDKNESLPAKYRAEQNAELAKQAMEKAKECSADQAASLQAASDMQSNHGNETGNPKPPSNMANEVYTPSNQKSSAVYPGNKGVRGGATGFSTLSLYKERYKKAFKTEAPPGKPSYSDWLALFDKEAAANGKGSTVLVGDSIVQAMPSSLLSGKYLNQGISGDTSRGVLDRINQVAKSGANKVVIAVGINDLLNSWARIS